MQQSHHHHVDSVFEFIKSQTGNQKDKLYQSSWACKAIFQSLSSLSKIYVMRLLFIEKSIETYELLDWIKVNNNDLHQKSLDELLLLRIFIETISSSSNSNNNNDDDDVIYIGDNIINKHKALSSITMNKIFQDNFKITICSPIEPWSNISLKPDKFNITSDILDNFSLDKWNEVLKTLVNLTPSTNNNTNKIVKVFDGSNKDTAIFNFLEKANLINCGKDGINSRKIIVTSEGKSFLLKDYQSQVWTFVSQVIKGWSNQEDALTLLFMLSYCEFGKSYAFDALTKSQRQLIYELYTFGIIYTRDITVSSRFYPTRIAINMIFQRDKSSSSNTSFNHPSKMLNAHKSDMKIIVQTNNQVVAYVSNELHIAMLKMFIDIQIRMPNMILGRITRSRIKEAYEMGIDSKQIMEFLSVHAHPIVANKDPIIPSNISDQLLIWEAERERVRDEEAIVIDFGAMGIITNDIFNNIYAYGRRLDTILWIDPNNLLIAVKPTGYADIESYIFEELKL